MSETEILIKRITDAAIAFVSKEDARDVTSRLLAAINDLANHAYAEGRKDEHEEMLKTEEEILYELRERNQTDLAEMHAAMNFRD